ncbi:MAG TPA: beta-phosphoglucomutase [Candidatus Faecousia excrementipullorum]|jgi:beta-phosphoglucomutase|nr:beta-phosphoglucomutase [Candidatus Faecousia excrementipullorum]
MNDIYAIIFDLDGVICTTDKYHYLAWKALADSLGLPFDEKVNGLLRGVSRMESLEIVLGEHSADYSQEQKTALAARKNEIYKSYLSAMTPGDLSKEVRSTLYTLRQRGYLLAIGSSSKNTRQILRQLGLGEFFDAVADGTMITRSKPDPEVFLLAASMLGVRPENAVVIEDAESGVRAAKAGRFRAIGIRTEGNDPNSDITIRHLKNLTEIL